jgi:hypothetical protein
MLWIGCFSQAIKSFKELVDCFSAKTPGMCVEFEHVRASQLPDYVFKDARRPEKKMKKKQTVVSPVTSTVSASEPAHVLSSSSFLHISTSALPSSNITPLSAIAPSASNAPLHLAPTDTHVSCRGKRPVRFALLHFGLSHVLLGQVSINESDANASNKRLKPNSTTADTSPFFLL